MPSQTTVPDGLLEALPDALLGVDQSGLIRFVNHQTESLFDYAPGELVGMPVETLVPQSHRQAHAAHRESYNAAPRTRPMGTDLFLIGLRRDGTEFPVDISLGHLDTEDGLLVIASVRDNTDRRKTEAESRQLARLAAMIEFGGDAIVGCTLDGIITSWNPAAERMSGWSGRQIIGKSVELLSPQDRIDEIPSILARISTGEPAEHLETTSVRNDGASFAASVTVSPIRADDGTVVGASLIARDVTQERQALEDAQRLAAIVEYSQYALVGMSLDGIITSWNPAAEGMFGWSREEIIGKPGRLLSPGDRANEMRDIMAKVSAGEPVGHIETVRTRKDGTTFPVSQTISTILDADGAIIGVAASIRDLTDQKRTFESARSMIEASLDSLVSISPEGKITDANETTVNLTGVPRDQLIGTSFSDYFTDPGKAEAIYQRVFTEGMVRDYPLTLRRRDGHETVTQVLYNASVYRDANGNVIGAFAAARDVTEQRQAQEKAAEQQAHALGRLAELERFQRLTVGRELKMIELKKELEYLRKNGPTSGGEPRDQQ
jgi:PAS domain S-box-containing protein